MIWHSENLLLLYVSFTQSALSGSNSVHFWLNSANHLRVYYWSFLRVCTEKTVDAQPRLCKWENNKMALSKPHNTILANQPHRIQFHCDLCTFLCFFHIFTHKEWSYTKMKHKIREIALLTWYNNILLAMCQVVEFTYQQSVYRIDYFTF